MGPPLLGFVGEAFGLRNALYIVLVPVLIAAVIASAVAMPAMPHGAAVAGGEDAKS